MVDAHDLDGHFQPALCQLVCLIDDSGMSALLYISVQNTYLHIEMAWR